MVFIDNLGLMLFTLPLTSVLIAYTTIQAYIEYRKRGYEGIKRSLDDSIIPAAVLALVIMALSLWGEFTWTLPGGYNILFYDVYILLGITVFFLHYCSLHGQEVYRLLEYSLSSRG